MRDRLAAESAEQREARLQHMREQMRDCLADESVEQREVRLQQMSDSEKEWMLRLSGCYHFFIFIHSHRFNLINHPPETLHYTHLFIQLDSFTICTLVYIIITILFLHLHLTITFRQTTTSACAHQLRLALNMTYISLVLLLFNMHVHTIQTIFTIPGGSISPVWKRSSILYSRIKRTTDVAITFT